MPEWDAIDPVFKTRYSFSRSTDEDGGEVQHVDFEVDPDGGVPPHIHHEMEERFTVLSGRAEFLSGRKWVSAGPGETVVVSPGTRHAFRNRGGEVAHVRCEARPPSSLQAFLTDAARLSNEGAITKLGLPKSPSGLLKAAVLVEEHRDMVQLLFPLPPPPLQHWIMGPLAKLAQRRGHGRQAALS